MALTSASPAGILGEYGLSVGIGQGGGDTGGGEPDPISGFSAQSGFTLSDNGDGTLTINDAQSRLGTKPNAALPVWFFDFGSGSDQPHPTLSRQQKVVGWNSACGSTTAVSRANATHSMTIDADADLGPVNTSDKELTLPANPGGKYYRYYDVYNDFLGADLPSGHNFKTHRWQSNNAQTTPYAINTIQGGSYRFYFVNDGQGVYDSILYTVASLTTKKWQTEEEYHRVSSAAGATDGVMYGLLNGEQKFARSAIDTHNGLDPFDEAYRWNHYKIGNFAVEWLSPGTAPWRANILYVDDSWCRVYITDKATWNTAEQKAMEIQVPTNWLASALTFHKRNGQFSSLSGKHLWVVDNDDNKILVGSWS